MDLGPRHVSNNKGKLSVTRPSVLVHPQFYVNCISHVYQHTSIKKHKCSLFDVIINTGICPAEGLQKSWLYQYILGLNPSLQSPIVSIERPLISIVCSVCVCVCASLWSLISCTGSKMGDRHHMLVCLSELRPFLTSLPGRQMKGSNSPHHPLLSLSPCLSTVFLSVPTVYLTLPVSLAFSCSPLFVFFSQCLSTLSPFRHLFPSHFVSLSLLLCLKSSQIPQQHMERESEWVTHWD